MANALVLCPAASIDALARRTPEPCVPMSERARASAVYSIKQRTLYLAFAKPPSPCAAMLAGCDGGVGQRDCPSVPLLRFAKWRGARRSALQWCKGGSGALFCGRRGVRERCSRAEGGLYPPRPLLSHPLPGRPGRGPAIRRAAREVPVPALAAGRQGACAPAARKPRQRARAAGDKSCSNGVSAGQATTRSSPA